MINNPIGTDKTHFYWTQTRLKCHFSACFYTFRVLEVENVLQTGCDSVIHRFSDSFIENVTKFSSILLNKDT